MVSGTRSCGTNSDSICGVEGWSMLILPASDESRLGLTRVPRRTIVAPSRCDLGPARSVSANHGQALISQPKEPKRKQAWLPTMSMDQPSTPHIESEFVPQDRVPETMLLKGLTVHWFIYWTATAE